MKNKYYARLFHMSQRPIANIEPTVRVQKGYVFSYVNQVILGMYYD